MQNDGGVERLFFDGVLWRGEAKEEKGRVLFSGKRVEVASFGIPEIDYALSFGGLRFGFLHEWFSENLFSEKTRSRWHPPFLVLSVPLRQAFSAPEAAHLKLAWIGRRCFPTPQILQQIFPEPLHAKSSWKKCCIFLNPKTKEHRLWSAIQALSSPSIRAVIVDASGFNNTAKRRLQHAALKGNTLGLILSPPWEQNTPQTFCQTCWKLSPLFSPEDAPCWNLTLLRARGIVASKTWTITYAEDEHDETHHLCLFPNMARRPEEEISRFLLQQRA